MSESAQFYFDQQIQYEEKAAKKFFKPEVVQPFNLIIEKLTSVDTIDESFFETVLKDVSAQTGLKLGAIAQGIRVALSGKKASPGLVEMINVLGTKVVIERLKAALSWIDMNV